MKTEAENLYNLDFLQIEISVFKQTILKRLLAYKIKNQIDKKLNITYWGLFTSLPARSVYFVE